MRWVNAERWSADWFYRRKLGQHADMGQRQISPLADKSRWQEKSINPCSKKNQEWKHQSIKARTGDTMMRKKCGSLFSNPGQSACYSVLRAHCSPWKLPEFRKKTDVGIFQWAINFGTVSPQGKLKREVTGECMLLFSCMSCPSSLKIKSQEAWMHITQATGNTQGNYVKVRPLQPVHHCAFSQFSICLMVGQKTKGQSSDWWEKLVGSYFVICAIITCVMVITSKRCLSQPSGEALTCPEFLNVV